MTTIEDDNIFDKSPYNNYDVEKNQTIDIQSIKEKILKQDKERKEKDKKQSAMAITNNTKENPNQKKTSIYNIQIQKLLEENPNITLEQWSTVLIEKRLRLTQKIVQYFPEMILPLDFALSINNILHVADITLPFMGIVLAAPSSMKTQVFEMFRKVGYTYFTDKFTAKSFVSHSANVAKDKLQEIDMLPRIKDKFLLTPELSPLFTGKDDDIKEQFGIITRILDGKGLETESGVHGQRGYYGQYMFVWLGAAVDIPKSVYKFLSNIGFKIYFLRLPRTFVSTDDLVNQLTSEKKFREKIQDIESLLVEYLLWSEICPISIGQNNIAKIEWNHEKDDRQTIKIIAELAQLLAHLRGYVTVFKSSHHDEFVPHEKQNNNDESSALSERPYVREFIHSIPIIEHPSRATQQLYNLARGHALSFGRNYVTLEDIFIVIKVVLSTGSIERVLILDLLIANKGTLTTSQITQAMRISNDTAKKTMTEFKGLELVTMERTGNNSNSEYKISLDIKFNWFLTEQFSQLRSEFKLTTLEDHNSKQGKDENLLAVNINILSNPFLESTKNDDANNDQITLDKK